MPAQRVCFGYEMIKASQPHLAFTLKQLPKSLRQADPPSRLAPRDKLDLIAVELDAIGAGDAVAIRTTALRGLVVYLRNEYVRLPYNRPADAIGWLTRRSGTLAIWIAWICARSVAPLVKGGEEKLQDGLKYLIGDRSKSKVEIQEYPELKNNNQPAMDARYAVTYAARACLYTLTEYISSTAGDACFSAWDSLRTDDDGLSTSASRREATERLWDIIERDIAGYPVLL